jgi:dTDP-4-dehydrorhamnose 3,5-epimerase
MRIEATRLTGCFVIELERRVDERGFFARSFCAEEFARAGLPDSFPQHNISHNARRGTLRGLHFQNAPYEEAKLVRCLRGAIIDVVVDLRSGSATRGEWIKAELSAENGRALFIPEGFAHGFQTLVDDTDVHYLMSIPYVPGHANGVRWDDSAFAIDWPLSHPFLSGRDAGYPDWKP